MNPFKAFRKAYDLLSSELTPPMIAFGMVLGLIIGFLPQGLSQPFTWLLIGLVLVTRSSVGFAMLTAGIVKAGLFAGGWIVLTATGKAILEMDALKGFWATVLNLPLLAFMGLERYHAMGGLVWATLLSVILFFPMLKFINWFRDDFLEKAEESKFVLWLRNAWTGRLVNFLLFGARGITGGQS